MYSKSDAGLLIRRGDGGDSPVTEGLGGPSAKLTFTSVGAGAGASPETRILTALSSCEGYVLGFRCIL